MGLVRANSPQQSLHTEWCNHRAKGPPFDFGGGRGCNPPLNAATVQPGPVVKGRDDTVCTLLVPLTLPVAGQVTARTA